MIEPPARERNLRRSVANRDRRVKPTSLNSARLSLSHCSISSSASIKEPIKRSSASAESGFPAAIFAIKECESSWTSFARFLEYAPSAATSFAPSANLGLVR